MNGLFNLMTDALAQTAEELTSIPSETLTNRAKTIQLLPPNPKV